MRAEQGDEDPKLEGGLQIADGGELGDGFERAQPHAVERLKKRRRKQHHAEKDGPGDEPQDGAVLCHEAVQPAPFGNGGKTFLDATEKTGVTAPGLAHHQGQGEPEADHGRDRVGIACSRQYRPREDNGARKRRGQNDGRCDHEAEGRVSRDHAADGDAHGAALGNQGGDESHWEQKAQGDKEDAPPAIGFSGAHHEKKERSHEEDDRGSADVLNPACLPE